MKKILLGIVPLLLIGFSFGYQINIHYNGNTDIIDVSNDSSVYFDGQDGSYSKNGNTFTFNSNLTGIKVYYQDQSGNSKSKFFTGEIYINGNSNVSYTGDGYTVLTPVLNCNEIIYTGGIQFTGSSNISGNIFTNFVDNSFDVIGTNIPNFISYGFVLIVLIILIRLIKHFKKGGKGRI